MGSRCCSRCGSDDGVKTCSLTGVGLRFRERDSVDLCRSCHDAVVWESGSGDRNIAYAITATIIFSVVCISVGALRHYVGF